ncbi:RNA polymerase [Wufeng Typhlomys cinereus jeilongvirus 1]|uniref:RNA-directed RNA polymerase L n=1 Tax=Wufeng Typhlomys cinereus jeilongvirus 1 TaxID=2928989 RepID=A0A8T9KP63_9MONO|nr:RNA polymerase [Wufeng Typhlomys cinereus jeilongvirus 1]
MSGSGVNDILYPECHLNSPIVTGKLVQLLLYANLPHYQNLVDDTLINNLDYNIKHGINTGMINNQKYFGNLFRKYFPNLKLYYPVPYPYGNSYLFQLHNDEYIRSAEHIFGYSYTCYNKIAYRLVDLCCNVEKNLGLRGVEREDNRYSDSRGEAILSLPKYEQSSKWYKPFLFWFSIKKEMREILKGNASKMSRHPYPISVYNYPNLFIQMNRNMLLIVDKVNKQIYYLTFEMMLMFSDVVEGRLMIDTAMRMDIRYSQFRERGYLLWQFIDSLFVDLGNNTYNIVAMIEPLVLGFLQLHDTSDILKGAFLNYCLKEFLDEMRSNGYFEEEDLTLMIDIVFKIFQLEDLHMTAEFFSFFRTFGHPTLEAAEAAEKVREHMNKPKVINFQVMMKGHALFCGMIINGYRDRHSGTWPPVTFPEHVTRRIVALQRNNEGITDEVCIQDWKSFVGFKFGCFMPLVLDEDLTMYMKDKALASIKSEWDCAYPRENLLYQNNKQTTSRRLVEVFINDEGFDPSEIINYVVNRMYLSDPDFNLSYSLKEKEIKKIGRLFAKMTYKMRACQVVAESLIATGVGRYFKENGMVKDEHELLKTLHKLSVSSVPRDNKKDHQSFSFNRDSHLDSSITYRVKEQDQKFYDADVSDKIQYETVSTFLTTDLQKFCLNWRQETTNIFAQRLNEIYGLPGFFNWLHKRLEISTLYVADPNCPPSFNSFVELDDTPNAHLYIKYPMGGIEGYCQKLWTIITIPFLFLSAYEVGAKIAAVVQGDNEAIAITRRVHPNLPFRHKKYLSVQLAQRYFNQLRLNMGAIGHNLKANETIVSSHFFVYSKRIYYDGLVLSQALKPISRSVFWSETIVDETRSACSNISTAISKSIEQGYSRWCGYAINVLKTMQQVLVSLKFTINASMTPDVVDPIYNNPNWIISATLIPSQLGGFNYLNISRLYVRNIGDPVTASLADVKRLINCHILDGRSLIKIMYQDPGNSSYLDWASDPYSLNIPHSQSVTMLLKNVTARMVLQNSSNPMLTGLFHYDFTQEDNDLARYLLDRKIIMPRAAHEILDKSLTGARQEIAGMLDSTKGLIKSGLRVGGLQPRLVERISLYDYEQFRVFNNLMQVNITTELIDPTVCSVELAIRLRKRMWFHLAHGRVIYGLEVPDVLEAVIGYSISSCEDCYYCQSGNNNYCWFFVPHDCELDNVNRETNTIRVPYFGSTTDERSEIKLSTVKSASRALKACIRIATIYTWAYGDTDANWEEAWYLSSFRANVTIDELKAITPISTSNNLAHRLRDKSTQMKYSSSTLTRVSRYTVISNDNLNFVIDDKKIDTNLVYQQVMLLGLAVLEDVFRFVNSTGTQNYVYHLHIVTNCCVIEMAEHPYVSNEAPMPVLRKVEGNRLVYDDNPIIDRDLIKIHNQLYHLIDLEFPKWTYNELNEGLSQSLAYTILEILTKETRDHLSEFKVLSNDDDINSLITEFLLVNPNLLTLNLGLAIAINWSYDIYYRRPEGKYQMVEYLNTILTTASRSLFLVLSNALSHPKVFQKFWDSGLIEPIYGPNLMNQDFVRMSIDYLVKCYLTYIDYWLSGQDCNYLLMENNDEIVDQRYEITQARHLCFLNCLYLRKEYMPQIRGLTSIEKCNILLSAIENYTNCNLGHYSWHIKPLKVVVYPASITYIRRGTIKQIRLRDRLLGKPITKADEVKEIPNWNYVKSPRYHPTRSTFFLATYLLLPDSDIPELQFQESKVPNRWECHIQRRVGINSTSCYKAVELCAYIQGMVPHNKDKLFLGEGSGAMMSVYYLYLSKTKIYYNTGVSSFEVVGQRVLSMIPSEAYLVDKNNSSTVNLKDNIIPLFNGKPECTWVGNIECFAYIMSHIDLHTLGMIHNDMESSLEKDSYTILVEQIHSLCLAVNLGADDSIYVCKLAPRDEDYSYVIINLLGDYYEEVCCYIPGYSNPYSPEIYILCYSKKSTPIIYPDLLLKRVEKYPPDTFNNLSNKIIGMKLSNYLECRDNNKRYDVYTDSDLVNLTKEEKLLLEMGFQVNGPKLIKQLSGHDVASGEGSLRSSIELLLNNLIMYCTEERDHYAFFDPYPILVQSKVREMLDSVVIKMILFCFLYARKTNPRSIRFHLSNLRRRFLYYDLNSDKPLNLIPRHMNKKLKKLGLNKSWRKELSVREIKVWWKVYGYSLLLN